MLIETSPFSLRLALVYTAYIITDVHNLCIGEFEKRTPTPSGEGGVVLSVKVMIGVTGATERNHPLTGSTAISVRRRSELFRQSYARSELFRQSYARSEPSVKEAMPERTSTNRSEP